MQRRLYLDFSDIVRIADGRADAAEVTTLRAALRDTDTRLTLSRGHTWDGLSNLGAVSADRLIRTVESFEPIWMVIDGPEVVEPLRVTRPDIVVQTCTSFRALANAPQRVAWLEAMDAMQTAASGAARGGTAPVRFGRRTQALLVQAFVSLCTGRLGNDVDVILTHWETELGIMNARDRATIRSQLLAVREVLRSLSPVAASTSTDMTAVLRALGAVGDDPSSYPGRRIGMVVVTAKQRDLAQKLQRNDLLDIEHAAHFPYVDVATCDDATYHAITTSVANVGGPRSAALARTGQLLRVVALLRERAAA